VLAKCPNQKAKNKKRRTNGNPILDVDFVGGKVSLYNLK
jgi:hypothetical protein